MRRLLALLALGALLVAGVASAASAPNAGNQAALDRTVRYLQDVQGGDGGFAGTAGGGSDSMFSAWVALALAAAGINPQDQKRPGGVDVHSYLTSHYQQAVAEGECAPLACTTTLERELMVVNASGSSPHDFGGVDLVAELVARADEDGAFPHKPGGLPGVNDTIFAIFALAPIQEPAAQDRIQAAADWIEAAQHESGGWHWDVTSSIDEVDMTGAAIQALAAAGRGEGEAAEAGLDYLRRAQNPDGGLPARPGNPESNVASTAWAAQAIWAAGQNPESWRTAAGTEPLGFMESLQAPDGHILWKRDVDSFGIWMTAYVTPAFAGVHWPIPAPPRAQPETAPPASEGSGVIAGGGGRGARLFSRPKPQSRGRTAGGARVLRSNDPVDRSETRRGANREQPGGTYAEEEASASGLATSPQSGEETPSVAAASPGDGSGRGGGSAAGTVTGLLVGSTGGESGAGAPGVRSAAEPEPDPGVAIAVGAGALLAALAGVWLERRRPWALGGVPA
ncbi:MAG TPA: prenyltransferase/squalene oxidase repeat-containing protein [Solirubrobacterales bacterium]|nr:prenyltransferase/squalene oxidase repeat-containing protein [Solirubrobacterales bacterium]